MYRYRPDSFTKPHTESENGMNGRLIVGVLYFMASWACFWIVGIALFGQS